MVTESVAGALQVASLGLRVLPVWGLTAELTCQCAEGATCKSPGKHPIELPWQRLATTNKRQIAHWDKLYAGCNFGVMTDDLHVVDVDPRNGGALETLPEWIPETGYRVATGGGGWHLGYLRNGTAP